MIKLRPLKNNNNDFELLYNWCNKLFVYEWFEQRPLLKEEIVTKYTNKLNEGQQELYIIQHNNKDIGYTQIYKYEDKDDIYEFDLFIGEEEYLNKGIGTTIVSSINNKINKEHNPKEIILRPFTRNIRAIRCYEKTGFKIVSRYMGKDTLEKDEEITVMSYKRSN